jgi:hypothetical protein
LSERRIAAIFSTMLVDIQRKPDTQAAYRLSLIGMHKHVVSDVLCHGLWR